MRLYHHKTDGGAVYLCSEAVGNSEEGSLLNSAYIVRIDGDIRKDAELFINEDKNDPHKRPTIKNNKRGNIKPLSKKGSLSTISNKLKYCGKHGLGNVYRLKNKLYAIHHYSNLSEIVPVIKENGSFECKNENRIIQVKRFDMTFKEQDAYIKKFIEGGFKYHAAIKV